MVPGPAILQVRISVDRVEEADGLLDQAFGMKAPLAISGGNRKTCSAAGTRLGCGLEVLQSSRPAGEYLNAQE